MADIREIQLVGLEIMKEVARICDRHQLTYYLSFGTLLGAIRHNGFIPWDDDVDLEMPVEDYRKFLHYAAQELPKEYFLQTYTSDPGYNELWAKIRKNGTTSLPIQWKNFDIHFGIGIDIFPLTGIYDQPEKARRQKKIHDFCRTLLAKDIIQATGSEDIRANAKLRLIYAMPRKVRIALVQMLEHQLFLPTDRTEELATVDEQMITKVKRCDYQYQELHLFEDAEFPIPNGYREILTTFYGDYMTPPPENERNHHENLLGSIIFDCHRDFHAYQQELRE